MIREKQLEAVLIMITGFLIISLLLENVFLSYLAIGIGILSVFFSGFLKLITEVWFGFAKILGFINAHIILSIVFFIFLFPVALIARIFVGKQLQLKKKIDENESYFDSAPIEYQAKDFLNPW